MKQTMQTQRQSHFTPRLSIVMTGLISLSLSGCCLFSPRKSDHHHAALVNKLDKVAKPRVITTRSQKQQITLDKLFSKRHS